MRLRSPPRWCALKYCFCTRTPGYNFYSFYASYFIQKHVQEIIESNIAPTYKLGPHQRNQYLVCVIPHTYWVVSPGWFSVIYGNYWRQNWQRILAISLFRPSFSLFWSFVIIACLCASLSLFSLFSLNILILHRMLPIGVNSPRNNPVSYTSRGGTRLRG